MGKTKVLRRLLVLLVIMAGVTFAAPVLAENVNGDVPFQIDLTEIITAVITLGMSALLAWASKTVLPTLKNWLAARTTAQQRQTLWSVTLELVKAAQQLYDEGLIKGPRLQHVINGLRDRGFDADVDTIKAAVKEINVDIGKLLEETITGETTMATELKLGEGELSEGFVNELRRICEAKGIAVDDSMTAEEMAALLSFAGDGLFGL